MKCVHCFGAGLVGSYVARKLASLGHIVHVHDMEPSQTLKHQNLIIHQGNALETDLSVYDGVDLVVNMLPGEVGHELTKKLLDTKWPIVDLSFSEHTPDLYRDEIEKAGARVLWDVGIAPGLSNMLLAEACRIMGSLTKAEIRVGGNPTDPEGEWQYMAPFSPKDVIAEYTRPARVVRSSSIVTVPALSERHLLQVKDKGSMEAFLTDGLRSVLTTIPAEEMSEYTVRWPGHIQKFIDERDSGNLNVDELLNEWWFDPKIAEFTWMEVIAFDSNDEVMRWEIVDHGNEGDSSMARTTGLVTLGCIISWLENPEMLPPGVHPPESLPAEVVKSILDMMKENGVEIYGPNIS